MKLVEAESTGPVEGDDALVTPPRPPHRRVSVSLLFTLTVLVGTVVTIYAMFPARNNVLLTAAIDRHRDPNPAWDLVALNPTELRAWAVGVVGKDVPLPGDGAPLTAQVIGVRRIMILDRAAALIRVRIGDDHVTYLVQHSRGIAPEREQRQDGPLYAFTWRRGPFTLVAVGPAASSGTWRTAFRDR
jgi:hypothetical protein